VCRVVFIDIEAQVRNLLNIMYASVLRKLDVSIGSVFFARKTTSLTIERNILYFPLPGILF
jgi:hypothetical protein